MVILITIQPYLLYAGTKLLWKQLLQGATLSSTMSGATKKRYVVLSEVFSMRGGNVVIASLIFICTLFFFSFFDDDLVSEICYLPCR